MKIDKTTYHQLEPDTTVTVHKLVKPSVTLTQLTSNNPLSKKEKDVHSSQ